MAATTGFVKIGNYITSDSAAVDVLLELIPNPDSTSSSGATQGGIGFLDEMSPACAAQLRVELLALKDAVDTTNTL